jgi:endonuclease/exonuclease/phosphatase family metal-dependent hydrolase
MAALERSFAAAGRPFPYDGFYFRAHANRIRRMNITTHGLAILVNTRRLRVVTHNVDSPHHITHHHVERFRDRKQARICAHLQVEDPSGRRLHVFNTHISLPTPFTRGFWTQGARMGWGPNQLHEARTLAAFVQRHAAGEPFVVCGDFNSAPGSPVFRFLTEEARFQCAQQELGLLDLTRPRAFPTAGFLQLRMHLDHLFFGNGVRFLDLEGTARFGDRGSPFAGLSDHVPLIGRLRCDAVRAAG